MRRTAVQRYYSCEKITLEEEKLEDSSRDERDREMGEVSRKKKF